MTVRRLRDLRRLLEAEAQMFGAKVSLEHTGSNHLRAVFSQGTNEAFIITGWSPSDFRVYRHIRADARRALRSLAAWGDQP
jgi:hypothetical protein